MFAVSVALQCAQREALLRIQCGMKGLLLNAPDGKYASLKL